MYFLLMLLNTFQWRPNWWGWFPPSATLRAQKKIVHQGNLLTHMFPRSHPTIGCAVQSMGARCLFRNVFFRLKFRQPFTSFESEVLNHLRTTSVAWEFFKVFQYWCEYRGGVPTLGLFLNIFNVIRISTQEEQKQMFISLCQSVNMFDVHLESQKNFKNYFLITLHNLEAHSSLYILLEDGPFDPLVQS